MCTAQLQMLHERARARFAHVPICTQRTAARVAGQPSGRRHSAPALRRYSCVFVHKHINIRRVHRRHRARALQLRAYGPGDATTQPRNDATTMLWFIFRRRTRKTTKQNASSKYSYGVCAFGSLQTRRGVCTRSAHHDSRRRRRRCRR